MKILKNIISFATIIFFISAVQPPDLFGETDVFRTPEKIKVVGSSQYLGYLNAYLLVTKKGTPVTGMKIYLNNLLLNELGGGIYSNGTSFHYNISKGKIITIKYIPGAPLLDKTLNKIKPITLGSYEISNCIQWIFPQPYSVISLGRGTILKKTINFKWNYTGKILPTKVTLENFTTHTNVFKKIVTAESVEIPTILFRKGAKYRFNLEIIGDMGSFEMTNKTAPGSKIKFYYWDHLYFTVK